MAKDRKKGKKNAQNDQATEVTTEMTQAPVTEQTTLSAEEVASVAELGLVDHGSQAGNWTGPVDAPQATVTDTDFDKALNAIPDDQVTDMTHKVAAAIDERAKFEKEKNGANSNIQKTLDKTRKILITKRAAQVLIATNIDPDKLLNRSIHQGSRYNVYALGKLGDVVFGLTGGVVSNAINRACMKSLFQMKAAGKTFTGEIAKACASDKIRSEAISAVKSHLIRHTVSESTAPTQASSTMQALETLGVVTRSGSSRNPTFELSTNPIVGKLEALLAA